MGGAKRSLEREYTRLDDDKVEKESLFCEAGSCWCGGDPAFAHVIDGNGFEYNVCRSQVDVNGALCGNCEDEIVGGDFIIGTDGGPVLACPGCEARFYE